MELIHTLINHYRRWLRFESFYDIQLNQIETDQSEFIQDDRYLYGVVPDPAATKSDIIQAQPGDLRIDVPVWFGNPERAKTRIVVLGLQPRDTDSLFNVERVGNRVFGSPFGVDRWNHNSSIRRKPQNKYLRVFEEVLYKEDVFILFSDVVKFFHMRSPENDARYNDQYARNNFFAHAVEEEEMLRRELEIISPSLVITLGADTYTKVSDLIGKEYRIEKVRHPAQGGETLAREQISEILFGPVNVKISSQNLEGNYLKRAQRNLWSHASVLRGDIREEDYHVILFLMTLNRFTDVNLFAAYHTDGIEAIRRASRSLIQQMTFQSNQAIKRVAEDVVKTYMSILERCSTKALTELLHVIESDNNLASVDFPEQFERVLIQLESNRSWRTVDRTSPGELVTLLVSMLEHRSGSVYNPFSGTASLAIELPENSSYIGQEINLDTYALANLRLFVHNRFGKQYVEEQDSILGFRGSDLFESFDSYMAIPPVGLKIHKHKSDLIDSRQKTVEAYFLERTMDALARRPGEAIIACSPSILFQKGAAAQLRQKLVRTELLECVMSLPSGLLGETNVPIVILKLNSRRYNQGLVKFVDASDCIQDRVRRRTILDLEAALDRFQEDSPYSYEASIDDIERNDFDLRVSRYFVYDLFVEEGFNSSKLGEMLTPIQVDTVSAAESALLPSKKLVRISDLSDDPYKFETSFVDLKPDGSSQARQKLSQDALLVATRWSDIKPTYFKYLGESVYLSRDVTAYSVNEEIVDVGYLVGQLHSELVQVQLKIYRTGNTASYLSKRDLLNIQIPLPSSSTSDGSLLIQRAQVRVAREAFIREKQKALELEKKLLGIRDMSFRDLASTRHSMRQYLNALKSNVAGTIKFMENSLETGITLKSIYSNRLGHTFGDHLNSLNSTIDSMSQLLDGLDMDVNRKQHEEHDLISLIKNGMQRFRRQDTFTFAPLYVDKASMQGASGQTKPKIQIWEEDFYKLMSNVISNATAHGFKEALSDYQIRISVAVEAEEDMCVIQISNNGSLPSSQFTFQHLKTRGEKTTDSEGTGVGGSDINQIVEQYKGQWDWHVNADEEFATVYEFKFPLILNDS